MIIHRRFNPRPLLLTGESLATLASGLVFDEFQSTPVIANGRIASIDKRMMRGESFQSTPVIANGRIAFAGEGAAVGREVSIHARYC